MYPPNLTAQDFRQVPSRFREEAIQEAWVAYLEGRNPLRRVWAFVKVQRHREARQVCGSQLSPQARLKTGPGTARLGWLSPIKASRGEVELGELGSDAHHGCDGDE